MSFKLGQRVIIIFDTLEQHLPVGEYAFVIAFERNADTVFDYVVRIPKLNRNVGVTKHDIETEDYIFKMEAERVIEDALIDFALVTKNKSLFCHVVGLEEEFAEQVVTPEQMSQEEFIRQVNLKAWI